MTAQQRSFLAFAVPLLLILVAALALGKDIKEPEFVQSWSVDSKAFGLFAFAMIATAGLDLFSDFWAIRIDPEGAGHNKRPFTRLIDNASTHASIAAVLPFAVYGTQISMWPYLTLMILSGILPILRSVRAYRKMKSQSE